MSNIEYHDRADGGWYCKSCSQYIHLDMIHGHNCQPINFFSEPNTKEEIGLIEELDDLLYENGFDPDNHPAFEKALEIMNRFATHRVEEERRRIKEWVEARIQDDTFDDLYEGSLRDRNFDEFVSISKGHHQALGQNKAYSNVRDFIHNQDKE